MNYLFDNITDKQKEKILKSLEAHRMRYPINTKIIKQEKNYIGLIEQGYVEIIKIDENGSKTLLEELEEKDLLNASISPFIGKNYEIIAKEETEITWIDQNQIWKNEIQNKSYFQIFLKNLLAIFQYQTEEKNERIAILTKKTIRNRLLEYFYICSSKYKTKYIYLPYTFTTLADYLAVDRSAMSREIKYLKEEGFIEIKGKKITLCYNDYDHIYKNY